MMKPIIKTVSKTPNNKITLKWLVIKKSICSASVFDQRLFAFSNTQMNLIKTVKLNGTTCSLFQWHSYSSAVKVLSALQNLKQLRIFHSESKRRAHIHCDSALKGVTQHIVTCVSQVDFSTHISMFLALICFCVPKYTPWVNCKLKFMLTIWIKHKGRWNLYSLINQWSWTAWV